MKSILGKKIGMTQIFTEEGLLIPVTVVEAGPMVVTQIKTVENDGYNAVQVGFVDKKEKKLTKALKGHFDKVEVGYKKVLREFPLKNGETFELGQEIKADLFAANDKVDDAVSHGLDVFAHLIGRHRSGGIHDCDLVQSALFSLWGGICNTTAKPSIEDRKSVV